MLSLQKKLKKVVIDALFPIFCLSCQKEGDWLCPECIEKIEILSFHACPACEDSITDKGYLCASCRNIRKSSLDALITAVSYENTTIKKMVHSLKYRFVAGLADPIARLISKALIQHDFPLPDYFVPVPLHRKRLRWRGFNQSRLIAEKISGEIAPFLGIEVLDALERKKFNSPQMEIKNYQERLRNVNDVFQISENLDKETIMNKKIMLVDDIATTGATLNECARILKEVGVRKVFAAVVARQNLKK